MSSKRVTRCAMLQAYNSFYFSVLWLVFLLDFEQFATNVLLIPVNRQIFATNPIKIGVKKDNLGSPHHIPLHGVSGKEVRPKGLEHRPKISIL